MAQTGKAAVSKAAAEVPARRSDATRSRISTAAREAFATLGYERATVRRIAEMANIHPPLWSCVTSPTKTACLPLLQHSIYNCRILRRIPRKKRGEVMVRTFLDRWKTRGVAGDLPALLRLSVTHPDGRAKAIEVVTKQVKPMIKIVSTARDPEKSSALIATQIVGVAFLRYVLRLPAVVNLSSDDLVRHVGETVQRYLEGQ